jgi:YHS domain-containing protein
MLRLLFYLLFGYALYRIIKGSLRKNSTSPRQRSGEVETFRDPVCGMFVTREDAVMGRLGGERIYFCSTECLEKYRQDYANTSTHAKESGGNK